MIRSSLPLLLVLFVALTTACSQTVGYLPKEPGRVHFVWHQRTLMLERDGAFFGTSGFSSDPIAAVAGVPAAEAHARSFVRKTWFAPILAVVGAALIVPSIALGTNEPGHEGQRAASVSFGLAAMATFITAMALPTQARHHLYDAVNIYNDERSQGISEASAP